MKVKKTKETIYGNNIRKILKEINMTQQELSDVSKLSPSFVSKIILGKRKCISLPIAFKISKALNKTVEEVFISRS